MYYKNTDTNLCLCKKEIVKKGGCYMEMRKPAYVGVAEVCNDWGCSRAKGYAIIKQLSEQMKAENPKLITMAGKINRIYYEEACMRR